MENTGLRAFLAVLLSMAILFGSQYLYTKYYQPQTQPVQQTEETKKEEKLSPSPILQIPSAKKEEAKPVVKDTKYKEVTVENEVFKVVLSNEGATIKSVELKKYKDSKGNPIHLSSGQIPAISIIKDGKFDYTKIIFNVDDSKASFKDSKEAIVVFNYSDENVSIKRIFSFNKTDYLIDVKEEISGIGIYYVTLGLNFGIFDKENAPHWGPVILKEADRIELNPSKIKEPVSYMGDVKWIAQEDKYFFSAIVPVSKANQFFVLPYNGDALTAVEFQDGINHYKVFASPKDYDYLKKFNLGLEHIVDFGFFSIIALPLFWFLKLLHSFVGNYGVAIIILTIIVRIPFIPIVNRGQKSMQKLSELQPKLLKLKEQYKNDPQRLQKEMMELYRKYKINPMSGCLPILLQIPVFFALYQILTLAIELRQAPFMLWIQDLSAKDPYYILPILMGATMLIQQKMTPSTADPTQQKIMLILPVVFTFLFLTFPSGLVLYWLINNIFGIAQQFYINQKIKKAK
ncbi:Inner membrane protein translocase component YidC, long form [Thermodesulfovibrio sp. N1]|uniref:membrane protein insertase YidC n=1 Tax=Thermodesulfovibrio sp. N1 TaxID=1871110 RepID=UPI00083A12A7|nr:membrane protein insertase YidC [Thermodesulfovibrio sp. N1]ODA44692.1 Inner membrane protein translocase component YidC, long form [Thermodesulfovibrio sp. N1]